MQIKDGVPLLLQFVLYSLTDNFQTTRLEQQMLQLDNRAENLSGRMKTLTIEHLSKAVVQNGSKRKDPILQELNHVNIDNFAKGDSLHHFVDHSTSLRWSI